MKAARKGAVALTEGGVEVAVLLTYVDYVALVQSYEKLQMPDEVRPPIPEGPATET